MCGTGFATTILSPVKWQLGVSGFAGGIHVKNTTQSKQYIQVVVKSGMIAIYTVNSRVINCESSLTADTTQVSKICKLDPEDTLYIDLDMNSKSASGNYQIAIV
jgi:hypothetical protein